MGNKFGKSKKFGESVEEGRGESWTRICRIAYGFNVKDKTRDTAIKHMFYNWDQEMEVIRNMAILVSLT